MGQNALQMQRLTHQGASKLRQEHGPGTAHCDVASLEILHIDERVILHICTIITRSTVGAMPAAPFTC